MAPKLPPQRPPLPTPVWPWGGPRNVRERLVDRLQLDARKGAKKGDAKNPPLASFALLDFMGVGHTSEELRLPEPDMPSSQDAGLTGFKDGPHLSALAQRAEPDARRNLERALAQVQAPPERKDRMQALLDREAQMLDVLHDLDAQVREIRQKMRDETREEGY